MASFRNFLKRARSFLPARTSRKSRTASRGPASLQPPYSQVGSAPLSLPQDMVGRKAELERLTGLLATRRVVFLHGPARIGKSYLARRLAEEWKGRGRPFLYPCPPDKGIGDLFRRLARFFWTNGQEEYTELVSRPESNDDDLSRGAAEVLGRDRYLVVLDSFERVSFRDPFRDLVYQICRDEPTDEDAGSVDEEERGRLLVCVRRLPPWFGGLPADRAGSLALGALCPADVYEMALARGFAEEELEGLEARSLHPFVLQLLLFLARRHATSPGALLNRVDGVDLEEALLDQVYREMQGRDVLDRMTVLRPAFRSEAFQAFGADEGMIAGEEMALLSITLENGSHRLHSMVHVSGSRRLAGQKMELRKAHEQAVAYYRSRLDEGGKGRVVACCEMAHHLLELDWPRPALERLADDVRIIVSFGYGRELLGLTKRIEAADPVESTEEPAEQARILRELALIYVWLPVFDIAENRLKAIRYCGRSVACYEQLTDSLGLASTLNVQGLACSGSPVGDPRKNIHRAFESYQQALAILQEHELPIGCAMVHNNMGAAWLDLAALGGEWCIGRALGHFKQAVQLYADGVDPYTRALVESNLGHALCLLGRVDEGMPHFRAALEHFRKETLPREYADTQKQLGDAHRLINTGNRPARLQQAMPYYGEAMAVYEQEIFPEDFACAQHCLAIAHRQLAIYEESRKHLALTDKCYRNALRVYTEDGFPYYHRIIRENLKRLPESAP